MRICTLIRITCGHEEGGMQRHAQELCEELVKRGHSVTVITTAHQDGRTQESVNGVDIVYLESTSPGSYKRPWWKESLKAFRELHEKEPFDIVHSQSMGAYGLADYTRERKIPVVTTLHGTHLTEMKSLINNAGRDIKELPITAARLSDFFRKHMILDRKTTRGSNYVICVSENLAYHVRTFVNPKDKVITIPNGVETTLFLPRKPEEAAHLIKRHNISSDDRILLSVGRLEKEKGVQNLINALPEVLSENPNVKALVVGVGPYLETLEKLAEALKISDRVVFCGRVERDDLPLYHSLASVFVTATERQEGLPLIILEAMACGRPVVASHIGGIPDVITHNENGVMVAPGNVELLADALSRLLADTSRAKLLGENARKEVLEKYSLDGMVDRVVEVYRKAIGVEPGK